MALPNVLSPWRTGENSEPVPADAKPSSADNGDGPPGTSPDESDWRDKIPSNMIAQAIADREGIATEEVPPLYDSVETEGLNAFLQSAPDATVSFPHRGYVVTVAGPGEVDLTRVDDD